MKHQRSAGFLVSKVKSLSVPLALWALYSMLDTHTFKRKKETINHYSVTCCLPCRAAYLSISHVVTYFPSSLLSHNMKEHRIFCPLPPPPPHSSPSLYWVYLGRSSESFNHTLWNFLSGLIVITWPVSCYRMFCNSSAISLDAFLAGKHHSIFELVFIKDTSDIAFHRSYIFITLFICISFLYIVVIHFLKPSFSPKVTFWNTFVQNSKYVSWLHHYTKWRSFYTRFPSIW